MTLTHVSGNPYTRLCLVIFCLLIFYGTALAHLSEDVSKPPQKILLYSDFPMPGKVSPGDRFDLEFFGIPVTVIIDHVSVNRMGIASLRGRLENYPKGYFSMSTQLSAPLENKTLAFIRIPEKNVQFRISYDPETKSHYLVELDPDEKDVLESGAPLLPSQIEMPDFSKMEDEYSSAVSPLFLQASLYDDDAVITIMVVYTPAARQWADDNTGGIGLLIAQAMESLQLASDNSNTATIFKLVHAAEVDYQESGSSSSEHLRRLQGSNDGYMDEVHAWRDRYGADLVALLARVRDMGGISYQLASTSGDPDYGFSLTRVQQAASSYTFAHEIGHNLGMGHHKEQLGESGDDGLFLYSAGWRWEGFDGKWYSTIMAYPGGEYYADGKDSVNLPYFSNPDIYHQGKPTGHYLEGDNARTLRQVRHVIAGYRPDGLTPPVIIKFSVRDAAVNKGEKTVIEWIVENADDVIIESDDGSVFFYAGAHQGERIIEPLADTVYTLTAVNENGEEVQTIAVAVKEESVADLPVIGDDGGGCFINGLMHSAR